MIFVRPIVLVAGVFLALSFSAYSANGMTFTRISFSDEPDCDYSAECPNNWIAGSGEIAVGDAARFEKFISDIPGGVAGWHSFGIVLDSPGGRLLEGIRLGEVFRAKNIGTFVKSKQACLSACAVAYLGGSLQKGSNRNVWRGLEPGGRIGFHGFEVSENEFALANDALDLARATNAVVRDYAVRMGVKDIGLLVKLFNTSPSQMEYVDTPSELLGLGLVLVKNHPRLPSTWSKDACRFAVHRILPTLDSLGATERVQGEVELVEDLEHFRMSLLDARFPKDRVYTQNGENVDLYSMFRKLQLRPAIEILAGGPLSLSRYRVNEIWKVKLRRGRGFSYGTCFAILSDRSIATIVLDITGEAIAARHEMLAGFPPDEPLW